MLVMRVTRVVRVASVPQASGLPAVSPSAVRRCRPFGDDAFASCKIYPFSLRPSAALRGALSLPPTEVRMPTGAPSVGSTWANQGLMAINATFMFLLVGARSGSADNSNLPGFPTVAPHKTERDDLVDKVINIRSMSELIAIVQKGVPVSLLSVAGPADLRVWGDELTNPNPKAAPTPNPKSARLAADGRMSDTTPSWLPALCFLALATCSHAAFAAAARQPRVAVYRQTPRSLARLIGVLLCFCSLGAACAQDVLLDHTQGMEGVLE